MLKNCLSSNDELALAQMQQRWLAIDRQIRSTVKTAVLASLGTEVQKPSQAAQCVAAIGSVELRYNEWPDLVQQLLSKVQSPAESVREASLEALGYLCEQTARDVLEAQSSNILNAVVHGMRPEESSMNVRFAATTALMNSIDYVRRNFAIVEERNYIMQMVCEATRCPVRRCPRRGAAGRPVARSADRTC